MILDRAILVTKQEAAKRLNVSVSTIDRLMKSGQLRYIKLMECVRFDTRDLDYLIDYKRFNQKKGLCGIYRSASRRENGQEIRRGRRGVQPFL